MSRERSNLGFADALNDLDLAEFSPKPKLAANTENSKSAMARAANAAGFVSRESKPTAEIPPVVPRTITDAALAMPGGVVASTDFLEPSQQRRRRTGRNAQINIKARPETIAAFCQLADRMGWGLGETFEKAVDLLERQYSPEV